MVLGEMTPPGCTGVRLQRVVYQCTKRLEHRPPASGGAAVTNSGGGGGLDVCVMDAGLVDDVHQARINWDVRGWG